jgi:hypothetical protein
MIAKENFVRTFVIGSGAVLSAALISILAFVLLGLLAPIGMMWALQGHQAVYESPAHGGAVLLVTVPLVGSLSVLAFFILAVTFFRQFSASRSWR